MYQQVYGCFSLKIIFRNTSPNKSFSFITTDSAVPLCQGLCIRLVIGIVIPFTLEKQSVGSMTEKRSTNYASAIADHMTLTGHRIKWDHFDILATGRSDEHCKIKETLLIRDLQPALNENAGSEKLLLYYPFICFPADFCDYFHNYSFLSLSLLGTGFSYWVLVLSFKFTVV